MIMKPNTKVNIEFIEAARHILRKVDESPDIVDQLSHMIQVEHAAPERIAHTYLYPQAKPLSMPSSPRKGGMRHAERSGAAIPAGWLHVSQSGSGAFRPFEANAQLVEGCEGILVCTHNSEAKRFKDDGKGGTKAMRDASIDTINKPINGRIMFQAKLKGAVSDHNRVKEEEVEQTGHYRLVHGAWA